MKNIMTGRFQGALYILGGLILLIIGTFMYYFGWPPISHQIAFFIVDIAIGLSVIFIGIYIFIKEGTMPQMDERTSKLTRNAGFLSWFITWMLMGIIGILLSSGVLHSDWELAYWIVWMSMLWTFTIFRRIVSNRDSVISG